jgi:hypothetical protein
VIDVSNFLGRVDVDPDCFHVITVFFLAR